MKPTLLAYHHGALGDVAAAFPFLERLKHRFGSAGLICQSYIGTLARRIRVADVTYPVESASFSSLYTDQPSPQAAAVIEKHDAVLLFSESVALARTVSQIAGKANVYQIPPRPPAKQRIHVSRHIELCLAGFGLIEPMDSNHRFGVLAENQRRFQWAPDPEKSAVAIHPGSGSPRKNRPLNFYLEIYDRLRECGKNAQFLLGPAESEIKTALERRPSPVMYFEGDPGLLVEFLLSSAGLVCNDSGIAHLSAYLGVPTLSLFGPSDPMRWRPSGERVIAIRPDTRCDPCFETRTKNCDHPECLMNIPPEKIVESLQSL